jgi:hypothetical protein
VTTAVGGMEPDRPGREMAAVPFHPPQPVCSICRGSRRPIDSKGVVLWLCPVCDRWDEMRVARKGDD